MREVAVTQGMSEVLISEFHTQHSIAYILTDI